MLGEKSVCISEFIYLKIKNIYLRAIPLQVLKFIYILNKLFIIQKVLISFYQIIYKNKINEKIKNK
jgi:hypothetical protein